MRSIFTSYRSVALLLLGLVSLLLPVLLHAPTRAAFLRQSPLRVPAGRATPAPSAPCLTAADREVTFAFMGYLGNGDGTYTLIYQVTNAGKHDISHVAFGTAGWTPLAPAPGSVQTGKLGAYQVEWTNANGHPGFPSIKFETQFGGYNQGKQDSFSLTLANFDASQPFTIQVKAGRNKTTLNFPLNDPACNRTPPMSTATPTLISPLPTPDGSLTLTNYHFGEPQVVLTHNASIGLSSWLPNQETALITMRQARTLLETIQMFHPDTGNRYALAERISSSVLPVWLGSFGKVAFTDVVGDQYDLFVVDANEPYTKTSVLQSVNWMIAGGTGYLVAVRSIDNTLIVMDAQGQQTGVGTFPLLSLGFEPNNALTYFRINASPVTSEVAIYDIDRFVILDTQTGNPRTINLGSAPPESERTLRWAFDAYWSPDGKYIALLTAIDTPPTSRTELAIVDVAAGTVRIVSLGVRNVYGTAWAANSRQFIVAGEVAGPTYPVEVGLFLVDARTTENMRVLPDQVFGLSSGKHAVIWSTNGQTILVQCPVKLQDSPRLVESRVCAIPVTLVSQ
jgi:hypothetical protein